MSYRVSSSKAPRFRQWVATVLYEHLTRGFTLKRERFGENAALLSNFDQEELPV
ncbi:RhuM family protein [Caldimonas thermodepolymerans]|uniref:RhuM family protein n=1 Tax=Caldimonas thermodepolymerans TaxID=215580 RepID=UPI003AFAC28C